MKNRFEILETPLVGLRILHRKPIEDNRGYLERLFCSEELKPLMGQRNVLQINHTATRRKGTVRGMHFQYPPHAEVKMVSCMRGEVFDVVVDLRQNSDTFLKWHAELLSSDNYKTLLIPEGFAHGFQTLTENCEMLYLHTNRYEPSAEGGVNPLDPIFAISWPCEVSDLSLRDAGHPMLNGEFLGVVV